MRAGLCLLPKKIILPMVCLALISLGWSYVSPEHKVLIDEGKEYKCTQLLNNQCITWDFVDPSSYKIKYICLDCPVEVIQEKPTEIRFPSTAFTTNDQWVEEELRMTVHEGGINYGVEIENAPKLTFKVNNLKPGTYYLWINGKGDPSSDSVNYGKDGQRVGTITFLDSEWSNKQQYVADRAVLEVDEDFILNLWCREDGVSLGEILLTQDAEHIPQ